MNHHDGWKQTSQFPLSPLVTTAQVWLPGQHLAGIDRLSMNVLASLLQPVQLPFLPSLLTIFRCHKPTDWSPVLAIRPLQLFSGPAFQFKTQFTQIEHFGEHLFTDTSTKKSATQFFLTVLASAASESKAGARFDHSITKTTAQRPESCGFVETTVIWTQIRVQKTADVMSAGINAEYSVYAW